MMATPATPPPIQLPARPLLEELTDIRQRLEVLVDGPVKTTARVVVPSARPIS